MERKPKKSTRPAGRRELTRARLIGAARDMIAERGFQRVSLDEIAARAGLTKGAIYDNFKSKDDLFLAVVAAWSAERMARFAWPAGRQGSLKARMRRLAEAVIADSAQSRHEAPMRAEFLLHILTHEEVRLQIAKAAVQRFAYLRERVLQFATEEELALPLDAFVLMIEALVPGLMFIRSQAPELVSDRTIITIFESFAAHTPG